jgi:hypothetical protein
MLLRSTPCTAPLQEKHSRKTGENTTNRAFLFVNLRLRPPYFHMRGVEMSMKSVFAFSFGGKYTIIKMICTAPISAR